MFVITGFLYLLCFCKYNIYLNTISVLGMHKLYVLDFLVFKICYSIQLYQLSEDSYLKTDTDYIQIDVECTSTCPAAVKLTTITT